MQTPCRFAIEPLRTLDLLDYLKIPHVADWIGNWDHFDTLPG
jgi:hypothetical protein